MVSLFGNLFSGNINLPVGGIEVLSVTPDELKSAVATSTVFPKAKSMEDKEIRSASVRSTYKCSAEKCHFGDTINQIQRSAELNQKGVKETAEVVINVIDQNQNLFTAHEVGGFVIQSMDIPFLFVENTTIKRTDNTPVGFIDLTEVRRGLIYKHMQKATVRENLFGNVLASVTTSVVIFALLKLSKKL
jgi:hypothetical protein